MSCNFFIARVVCPSCNTEQEIEFEAGAGLLEHEEYRVGDALYPPSHPFKRDDLAPEPLVFERPRDFWCNAMSECPHCRRPVFVKIVVRGCRFSEVVNVPQHEPARWLAWGYLRPKAPNVTDAASFVASLPEGSPEHEYHGALLAIISDIDFDPANVSVGFGLILFLAYNRFVGGGVDSRHHAVADSGYERAIFVSCLFRDLSPDPDWWYNEISITREAHRWHDWWRVQFETSPLVKMVHSIGPLPKPSPRTA